VKKVGKNHARALCGGQGEKDIKNRNLKRIDTILSIPQKRRGEKGKGD